MLFSLHFLKNGAIRSRVVEKEPLNGIPRWEDDVILLKESLNEIKPSILSSDDVKNAGIELEDNTMYISTPDNNVIVGLVIAPFSFTVYVDGKPRIGANHKYK